MATTPDPLEALFSLIPDAASNPVGTALHQAWVKLVEVSVPGGHWLQRSDAGDVTPYSWLLYGCMGPQGEGWTSIVLDPTASAVGNVLGTGWWTPYSLALTTQTVYNVAPAVRNQVNAAAVDADVAARHDALRGSAVASYVIAFAAAYQAQLAAVPGTGAARWQAYRDKLGPPWIALKKAEYSGGNWPDPGWDLFHHAVKLLALGAAQADVTAILTDLAAKQLPMPDVQAANWTTYLKIAPDPMLQWADMAVDGRTGMLHYTDDGGESWDMVDQGISLWFVADTPYWVAAAGQLLHRVGTGAAARRFGPSVGGREAGRRGVDTRWGAGGAGRGRRAAARPFALPVHGRRVRLHRQPPLRRPATTPSGRSPCTRRGPPPSRVDSPQPGSPCSRPAPTWPSSAAEPSVERRRRRWRRPADRCSTSACSI